MRIRYNAHRFDSRFRGQLVLLLHRDPRQRHRLALELVRLGHSVLSIDSEAELADYLDGAGTHDPRVAFAAVLLADEITLGLAGLRRLATLGHTACPLPIVLLSDFATTPIIDEEVRAGLHVAAVLRRPYTQRQLVATMARLLPSPYTDETSGCS